MTPDRNPAHVLPLNEIPNVLNATVSNGVTQFTVAATVRITSIKDSFVSNNKLVAIGDAGDASNVVVIDLMARRLADWFFCYAPKHVSPNWIVYVEWYQGHGIPNPNEVVLLYDLTRTPEENRLPAAGKLEIPAPIQAGPVVVGIPIYPESNARAKSYRMETENALESELILRGPSFLFLPPARLVFVALKGHDALDYSDYLVVVDLSRGIENAAIQTIDIPKDQLKRSGANPNYIQVAAMQAVSTDMVRLLVPEAEYGVSSITVAIP